MTQESLGQPRVAEVAATLQRIWEAVLGTPVSPTDNFLDLGGDSFRVVRVLTIVREELGCEISPVDMFDRPTVAELAPLVVQLLSQGEHAAAIPADRE
jgi:acyl carrier protein